MFLTKDEYYKNAERLAGEHWSSHKKRWGYHSTAVEILKENGCDQNSKILEIGTMGTTVTHISDTLDYVEKWDFPGKNPTHVHDCRQFPWPIKDKQYDWAVALRVFQHLKGFQKEAFQEMKRISKNFIIVVPETYDLHDGKGLTLNELIEFNNGVHPDKVIQDRFGPIYYWTNV